MTLTKPRSPETSTDSVTGLLRPSASPRAHRTLLLGLLLLNVLVIAICAALLLSSRRAALASEQTEAFNDVRLATQAAGAILDKATIALSAVVVQVERQLAGNGLETGSLWAMVDAQAAQVNEILRIGLFDSRGQQLCGIPLERCQRLEVSDRDYFQHLRDHPEDPPKLYGPARNKLDGSSALVLARALKTPEGGFAGVAIALMPTERLRPLLSAANVGPGGSIGIRTADLVSILRHPEFAGPDADAASQRVSETMRAAVAASPTEGVYTAVAPADDVERLVVYRRLDHHPLYLLEGRAISHILAEWRVVVAWTTTFLLLFAGISVLLARTTIESLRRQARALQLYDDAPCGYHTLDPDGTYRSINATELRWLGCTREEVVGRLKPTDFCTDEGRATFSTNFPELLRTGRLEGLELDLVGRDGTTRHVSVNASAVYDAHGKFLTSNSVLTDITDLSRARALLRALAQQQGVMLDNELIGMVRLKDRRTVWKNQAMDRIFGYSGSEWDHLPSRALFLDDATHERIGQELRAATRQSRAYRTQLQMRHKEGHAVWIDASAALLPETSDEVIVMFADITPLKAAEETRLRTASLEAQNFQLRETSRLKNEFMSNMSHELHTPLNAIIGFGQMLQSGVVKPDSPKFADYIDKILASGRHLLSLIDQVLDYAKAEAGKLEFNAQSVSVGRSVQVVVDMLRRESDARRITVRVEIDEALVCVVADPLRLRQMLFALIGNAIKFSHDNGSVEVAARVVDEQYWQVQVTDHGIGIEEANLKRLFHPFVQLSSGTTKTYGGTGIGLALVRTLAIAQGGRIDVQSQPGQGSTFTLTLPRVLRASAGDK